MTFQVFVDDSGTKGQHRHFALVGLLGHSSDWDVFCQDWRACLDGPPKIAVFKMREAAKRSGDFNRFSVEQRDERLRSLARIINRAAQVMIYSISITTLMLRVRLTTMGE